MIRAYYYFAAAIASLLLTIPAPTQTVYEVLPRSHACEVDGVPVSMSPGIHRLTYVSGSWSAWNSDYCPYSSGCWLNGLLLSAPNFGQRWIAYSVEADNHYRTDKEAEAAAVGMQIAFEVEGDAVITARLFVNDCGMAGDNRGGPIKILHDRLPSLGTLIGGGSFEENDWGHFWATDKHNDPYGDHVIERRCSLDTEFPTDSTCFVYLLATERDQGTGDDPYVAVTTREYYSNAMIAVDFKTGHGYCDAECDTRLELIDSAGNVVGTPFSGYKDGAYRQNFLFQTGPTPVRIRFRAIANGVAGTIAQVWMYVENIRATPAVTLLMPEKGSLVEEISEFIWARVGTGTYLIEFATDPATSLSTIAERPEGCFANLYPGYQFIAADTFWAPQRGMFTEPGTYYWHVAALIDGSYTPFSDIWSFTIIPGDTGISVDYHTNYDCIHFTVADSAANPMSGATVTIYRNSMSSRSFVTDGNGQGAECALADGQYTFDVFAGGERRYSGAFTIDRTNQPPLIDSLILEAPQVTNSGIDTVLISAFAIDPENKPLTVSVDLRSLGGPENQELPLVSAGQYRVAWPIASTVVAGAHPISVRVTDTLLAQATETASLIVAPSAPATDTFQIGAFNLKVAADHFSETSPDVWLATGNVRIFDDLSNSVLINTSGSVVLDYNTLQISSSGEVTVSANLGSILGIWELYRGQFTLDADVGTLTPGAVAQNLLDEVVGFMVDTSTLQLNLNFGAGGGVSGVGTVILDELDGNPGNLLPQAEYAFHVGFDGSIDGSLQSDSLVIDCFGTTLVIDSLLWDNAIMTAYGVDLAVPQVLSDTAHATIETLTITPEGINVQDIAFSNWNFNLAGFTFHVAEAALIPDGLRLTGSLMLPGDFDSVYVQNMTVVNNQIEIEGGGFNLPELMVGEYPIGGISGHFETAETGALVVRAGGTLGIPQFANIRISFALDASCPWLLKEFCMAAEDLAHGVPIGATGLYLTDIGGCLVETSPYGLCDNRWRFLLNISIASSTLQIPIINEKAIRGDVQLLVETNNFHGDGTVYLAGYQLGNAYFDLTPKSFRGHGGIYIPPQPNDWLEASADILIKTEPRLSFRGEVSGQLVVPFEELQKFIFWASEDFEVSSFRGGIDILGVYGEFEVWVLRLAAELMWNGEVILGGNIGQRGNFDKNSGRSMRLSRLAQTPTADTLYFLAVDSGVAEIVYAVSYQGPAVSLALIRPDSTILEPGAVDPADYVHDTDRGLIMWRNPYPDSGVWGMIVEHPDTATTYAVKELEVNARPTISVSEPGDLSHTSSDSVLVKWSWDDFEQDPLQFAVLYCDTTDIASGIVIEDGIQNDSSTYWSLTEVPSGIYRLMVVASDGRNAPVQALSPGLVTVENTDSPSRPALLLPRGGDRKMRLEWLPGEEDDLGGYWLFWGAKDSTIVDSVNVGHSFDYVLENLSNDLLYKFAIRAYDQNGNASPLSTWMYGMPMSFADADAPPTPVCTVLTDDLPNSVTLAWNRAADAAGYQICYDMKVGLPYDGVGLTEGDSPIDVFQDTSLTLTGLMPGETYFFGIRAYDAIGNRSSFGYANHVLVCCSQDTDADGLDDDWEMLYFGALDYGCTDDPDSDNVINCNEQAEGTDPTNRDTDADGVWDDVDDHPLLRADNDNDQLPDDWESFWGVTEASADPDEDSLVNLGEFFQATSPTEPDSDHDGFTDGYEVGQGSDPNDAASVPNEACGDVNKSGTVNVADVTFLIAHVFRGGPPPSPVWVGDVDGSGGMNVADLTMIIAYLWRNGAGLRCVFPIG